MTTQDAYSKRPLIVVSNRLPVTLGPRGWQVSAGGLVTALRPVMERLSGAWVGWDGGAEVPETVPELDIDLAPIPLSRSQIQSYYHGFANRTIWPLFHDLIEPARLDRSWWRVYTQVNEKFAKAAAALPQVNDKGLLWVQDYHLMLVPGLLREQLSHSPIGFFLHIPWPPPELFSRLPWRETLLRGVLGADVVSFHTERYRKNFARTCARLLPEATVRGRTIVLEEGRKVVTADHPISIDAQEYAGLARSDEVRSLLRRLRTQYVGRTVLLGVDRLDYTKGILERLKAFENLLERRPDLRHKLALVQIAVPSREAVTEYRELRAAIEQAVGRINGAFTELGRDVPVHYIHRSIPRPRLVAFYLLADVMLVTPLKDGMNLVAKEYVASQQAGGGFGVLVLSEFTGAALELDRAVECNPFDVEGLSHRIEHALEIKPEMRREDLAIMARRVQRNDVYRWVRQELATIDDAAT